MQWKRGARRRRAARAARRSDRPAARSRKATLSESGASPGTSTTTTRRSRSSKTSTPATTRCPAGGRRGRGSRAAGTARSPPAAGAPVRGASAGPRLRARGSLPRASRFSTISVRSSVARAPCSKRSISHRIAFCTASAPWRAARAPRSAIELVLAELLAVGVPGLGDAVGVDDQRVAGAQLHRASVVVARPRRSPAPGRRSLSVSTSPVGAHQDRRVVAGVHVVEPARGGIERAPGRR